MNVGIFIIGAVVTAMVLGALLLLFYGAVLDGRDEAASPRRSLAAAAERHPIRGATKRTAAAGRVTSVDLVLARNLRCRTGR